MSVFEMFGEIISSIEREILRTKVEMNDTIDKESNHYRRLDEYLNELDRAYKFFLQG